MIENVDFLGKMWYIISAKHFYIIHNFIVKLCPKGLHLVKMQALFLFGLILRIIGKCFAALGLCIFRRAALMLRAFYFAEKNFYVWHKAKRKDIIMFDNVGGKIKTIASVFFWIEAIGFIIWGLITCFAGGWAFLIGLGIAGGGFLTAWISALFLYGFGELVESVEATRYSSHETEKTAAESRKLLREIIDVIPKRPIAQSNPKSDDELPPM